MGKYKKNYKYLNLVKRYDGVDTVDDICEYVWEDTFIDQAELPDSLTAEDALKLGRTELMKEDL